MAAVGILLALYVAFLLWHEPWFSRRLLPGEALGTTFIPRVREADARQHPILPNGVDGPTALDVNALVAAEHNR